MSYGCKILCYKSKTLADGAHPLMIRINKGGKRKFISLGVSVLPKFWDFEKNQPKKNCPNKLYIEKLIAEKSRELTDNIIEMKSENKDFTASTLAEKMGTRRKKKTVGELFSEHIGRLKANGRTGYALSFLEVCNSMKKYNGHLDIYFSEIDTVWLKRYEEWLRGKGAAENTIGRRMRTLRALYNVAIEEKQAKAEDYPFKAYKVSKLRRSTAKRAISKADVLRILAFKASNAYTRLALDLFSFSYFTGGINFVDMAYLTKENLMDGRLVYVWKKTHKLIRLSLHPAASDILARYANPDSPYLFPVLSSFHKTEQQQRNRIHKVITTVNKRLKFIGESLGIQMNLTTYVARHSFATVLKREGVSTAMISEALGHSSEKVTQYYLASFEDTQMQDAMKHLL